MCIFLLAAGLSLLNHDGSRAAQLGPVVLFVYLFTICYSLGEGPVAFQYSAEVFPTIQREQGMAWAVCINNTFGERRPNFFSFFFSKSSPGGGTLLTWVCVNPRSRYPEHHLPSHAVRHDAHGRL